MAFPTWQSTTGTAFATETSPQSANMPATVNSGDLLILVAAFQTAVANASVPSGWTGLEGPTDHTSGETMVAAKAADGTEGGGTVDITLGNTRRGAAQVIRVTGWHGTVSGGCEEGGTVIQTGTDATPDAGSFSPSWGSADTLWVWYVGASDDDEVVDGAPTGYTNLTSTSTGAGANASATVGSASRTNAAASEDPGAGSLDAIANYVTGVIAVRPAGGGGPTADVEARGIPRGVLRGVMRGVA